MTYEFGQYFLAVIAIAFGLFAITASARMAKATRAEDSAVAEATALHFFAAGMAVFTAILALLVVLFDGPAWAASGTTLLAFATAKASRMARAHRDAMMASQWADHLLTGNRR
jgi:hypothetical protein